MQTKTNTTISPNEEPDLIDDEDENETSVSYEMVKESLKITDSETGKSFKLPKKFKYLKLIEDDEGEYKLALCNKKGKTLFDYKKYAKMNDKYKYVDVKAINLDEDIELDDYEEGDTFSIHVDKNNPQIIEILDYDKEEVGRLNSQHSVYYLQNEDSIYWSVGLNKNKIVTHPDREEIDLDDYNEKDLFSIQVDDQKIMETSDIYEDEIGMLSNNYLVKSNDVYYF